MSNQWSSSTNPDNGRVWRRPLGAAEASFYWASILNGSFDSVQYFELALDRSRLDVMEPDNIRNTWLAVKRHFPMVSASLVRMDDDQVYYEISEKGIHSVRDGELDMTGSIASKEEAAAIVDQFLSGPRQLTTDMNVRLVIRSGNDKTSQATGAPVRYHFFFIASHPVSDGAANASLYTTFMSMLTTPSRRAPRASIEERLAMIPDGETLHHKPTDSPARRKWRRAIASVLIQLTLAKMKGGQTLPNKVRLETFITDPDSKSYGTSLTANSTKAVFKNCRSQGFTFGSAVMPLCQIAHARVLHRRRHTMQPEEWEERRRGSMYYGGPVNVRPMMPDEWKKKGGMTEYFMLITPYQCTLPRMPSCNSTEPSYEELLSRKKFVNRCISVKNQTDEYVNHPLFHEMNSVLYLGRLENQMKAAKLWEKQRKGELTQEDLAGLAEYVGSFPYTITNAASSFGSMEDAMGKAFPSPSDGKIYSLPRGCATQTNIGGEPFLKLLNVDTHLRAIPCTIYLTIMGNFGRLWVWCWWDGNAYDVDLIKEWVDEIAKAADFYLGGSSEDRDKTESSGLHARL